jgi:mRNA interferase MazF
MVIRQYIPDQGDIIMIDLDPQLGTEISKRRPCLVISKKVLNKSNHRVLICPITSTPPQSHLQLTLPSGMMVKGTLLIDQIRTLDYTKSNPHKIDRVTDLMFYDKVVDYIGLMVKR